MSERVVCAGQADGPRVSSMWGVTGRARTARLPESLRKTGRRCGADLGELVCLLERRWDALARPLLVATASKERRGGRRQERQHLDPVCARTLLRCRDQSDAVALAAARFGHHDRPEESVRAAALDAADADESSTVGGEEKRRRRRAQVTVWQVVRRQQPLNAVHLPVVCRL